MSTPGGVPWLHGLVEVPGMQPNRDETEAIKNMVEVAQESLQ